MKIRFNLPAILAVIATYARAEAAGHEGLGLHRRDLVVGSPQVAVAADPLAAAQVVQAPVAPQLAVAPQVAVQPQVQQVVAQPQVQQVTPVAASPQAAVQPQLAAGVQRFADTTQILVQAPSPAVAAAATAATAALLPPAVANVAAPHPAAVAAVPAAALAPAAVAPMAADLATAPVYLQQQQQQQFYPAAAAGGQPFLPQLLAPQVGVPGGLIAGAVPGGLFLGNPFAPQALMPLDPSVNGLLSAQTAIASAPAADASAEATADTAADESATAESAPADEEATTTLRHKSKAAGKTAKAHAAASRKAKAAASSIDDDSAEPAAETADAVDTDAAETGVRRKSRGARKAAASGAKSGRGGRKAALRDDDVETEADDDDFINIRHYKASVTAAADDDDALSADALDAQSEYKPAGSGLLPRPRGSLREEAARAREEASLGARDAVLSEIRVQASADAAQEASSMLHLEGNTIVRDEEASASRIRDSYETVRAYSRESPQHVYIDDAPRARAGDEEGRASTATGRYADRYAENTSTWDVKHAVAWANSRSYDRDEAQSSYHPYDTYSDASYNHGASPYADGDRDSSMSDNTYTHTYDDNTYTHTYGDNAYTHTYGDNTYTYTRTYADNSDSYDGHPNGSEHTGESQGAPYNLVNRHADSIFASDASAALSSAADNSLRAVNDLDPLSYATQGCSFRSNLPLSAPPDAPRPEQPSIMIIGLPPQPTQPAVMRSVAPSTSTIMVTKLVTPSVKVIVASDSDED